GRPTRPSASQAAGHHGAVITSGCAPTHWYPSTSAAMRTVRVRETAGRRSRYGSHSVSDHSTAPAADEVHTTPPATSAPTPRPAEAPCESTTRTPTGVATDTATSST